VYDTDVIWRVADQARVRRTGGSVPVISLRRGESHQREQQRPLLRGVPLSIKLTSLVVAASVFVSLLL